MNKARTQITILALALAAGAVGAAPSGPAFTYQGRLTESGAPANGLYDMVWRLFDAPSDGTPLGPTATNQNVAVTDGLFNVELGLNELSPQPDPPGNPAAIDDEPVWNRIDDEVVWLEVGVRRAGSSDPFRILSPRQHMTSAPHAAYATHSRIAASLAGPVASNLLAGTYSSPVVFNHPANQFVGSGAGLSDLNAAQLAQGTIPDARLGNHIVRQGQDVVLSNVTATGHLTATGDVRAERLVVGSGNVLTSPYGVIAGGTSNTVTAPFGAILSGANNFVASDYSVICGGVGNVDLSHMCFIGSGTHNTILGGFDTQCDVIAGGEENTIEGNTYCSTIGGGSWNLIGTNSQYSFIGGGRRNANHLSADYSVIAGGYNNNVRSNADYSVIGGGRANTIQTNADYVVIAGGTANIVGTNADRSVIGGGEANRIYDRNFLCTIPGGGSNTVQSGATASTIGGGFWNVIQTDATNSTISGGSRNIIETNSIYSTIGGGLSNLIQSTSYGTGITNNASTISGGERNTIQRDAQHSTIAGGLNNTIESNTVHSAIGGGKENRIRTWATASVIGGGSWHRIEASYGAIGGGQLNVVEPLSFCSTVSGGASGLIQSNSAYSVIGGGDNNTVSTNAPHATIGGGYYNNIQTNAEGATIPGGLKAVARNYGQMAYASGAFGPRGDAQTSTHVLRCRQASMGTTELYLDGSSRRMKIPQNTTWTFDILVAARSQAGTSAGWEIRGVVENDAGTAALVGTPTTTALGPSPPPWQVSLGTRDDALAIAVMNFVSADLPVRWVATVRTAEVSW